MREMIASLQAADDVSQSSKGGAEEGEGEGEEEQADDSDGEPAGQLPAYAQGNPRELQSVDGRNDGVHRTNAAQGQDVNAAQE